MCGYTGNPQATRDGLIDAIPISQPTALSPDPATLGVLSSLPFLPLSGYSLLSRTIAAPVAQGAWYQLAAFLVASLEPSTGLSSYVAVR
jgi:predicted secreted protein